MPSPGTSGYSPKLNPSGRKTSSEAFKGTMVHFLNMIARTPLRSVVCVRMHLPRASLSTQASVSPVCACRRINSSRTDSLEDGRTLIARSKIQAAGTNKIQNHFTDLRFRIELFIYCNLGSIVTTFFRKCPRIGDTFASVSSMSVRERQTNS